MLRNVIALAFAAGIAAGLGGCSGSLFEGPGVQARETESGLELSFGPAFFDDGTAELGDDGRREVELIADLLQQKPMRPVLIEGHSDESGSDDDNASLSTARAQAVKQALIAHGVRQDRLIIAAMGEAAPAVVDAGEGDRAKNRRVEVIIR